MNRQELKKILKDQSLSFTADVQKKMLYLQGENAPEEDDDISSYSSEKDDLLDAFVDEQDSLVNLSKEDNHCFPSFDYNNLKQKTLHEQYVADEEDYSQAIRQKTNDQDHKKSFAERIAALRGISLPGDYLRHHS